MSAPRQTNRMPLQFGHACLRVETRLDSSTAKSKRSLQFGHACLRVETGVSHNDSLSNSKNFNSATPACAWRLAEIARTHGMSKNFNSATPACAWRPHSTAQSTVAPINFNSATPACAWRLTWTTIRVPSGWSLQFGHACLRVETAVRRCGNAIAGNFNSATPACAWRQLGSRSTQRTGSHFNSATPACAWRHRNVREFRTGNAELQFGHACLRVETAFELSIFGTLSKLQFGHACLRVETHRQRGVLVAGGRTSIRPRLLARGDVPSSHRS